MAWDLQPASLLSGGDTVPPEGIEREKRMTRSKGAMTVAEAGRRGGATTAQRHGPEFYEQIGKQGGQKVKELYGPRFYGRIGKIGGDTVSEKYGHEHFEEIGKKGGQKVAEDRKSTRLNSSHVE